MLGHYKLSFLERLVRRGVWPSGEVGMVLCTTPFSVTKTGGCGLIYSPSPFHSDLLVAA